MDPQRLAALLGAAQSPLAPPQQRQAAEAELQALSRSPEGLEWALGALTAPPHDAAARWWACSVIDEATHYRWARLSPPQQAAVRAALWAGAADPAAPHFQRAKLAASLAHVAAVDGPEAWPEFLPSLQAALGEPARWEAALDLLAATLDHFHALAQATSAGLRGKVPSAAIPAIQQRFRDLQPLALATLCSLLQQLRDGLPAALQAPSSSGGAENALSLAAKALRALRAALTDTARLPEQQGVSCAALVGLLFDFVAAAQLAPPGSTAEHAAAVAAAAALDCASDLCSKYLGGAEATRSMLEVLVPKLQDTCALVQQRWAQQGGVMQAEDPLLTAAVRLLVQFFSTQLSNVEATPHLSTQLDSLLAQVLALSTGRRSPVDLLLFLEVWHAVLGHVSGFEDALWECEGDSGAQERVAAAIATFTEPVLAVADLVLSTLCLGAASAPPPFTADALSSAPGSGSAMEDWLAAVVAGGDMEGEQLEAAAAAEKDDGESDELLVPGAAQGSRAFQADSERDVYVRHCEGFLGQVIGSFAADMVPRILLRLQACTGGFAAACEAVATAARAAQQQQQQAAALDAQVAAFRAMDVCLQLLIRCGPHFSTRGAADAPVPLSVGGSKGASGAHAVQSMRGLLQLASGWLHSVQAIVAATQQAGPPATPAHSAAVAGAGLQAMLIAGSRLHKAVGSLTATWLSQLVMGLVQQSADPDAATAAQELVQGVLSSAAALLTAVAASQMDGWRPLLHRAAVWAAESLVSLSSIALSSSLKPPAALLGALWQSDQAQALLHVYQAALANPTLLPLRACRALGICLSDLALRSWPAQPAAQFDAESRGAAFTSVATPLVQLLQAAAAAPGSAGSGNGAAAVRQAAAVATSVVQSYAGSPKVLRSIVSTALVFPALPSVVTLLQASGSGGSSAAIRSSRAAAVLLRLITCCLESLPTELGSEGVEQLLSALVQAFATPGGDPSFESDLLMARLLTLVLSQGGAQKHRSLLQPALHYLLAVWHRASSPQAAAATDADLSHARAVVLAALLCVLRYKWQAIMGGGAKPVAGDAGAPASAGAHPLAASLQQHAAANGQQQHEGAAEGPGAALAAQALQLLLQFFTAAGSLQVVLAAGDVRLVLEELYELQVSTRLYTLPLFAPLRPPLADALLALLASRLYTGAQDDLSDSLFSLAAANWSEFHLQVLPRFVEQRLGGLGASERASLLALFEQSDLDAHAFESRLRLYINDCIYFERSR